jgi:hypothetical protein
MDVFDAEIDQADSGARRRAGPGSGTGQPKAPAGGRLGKAIAALAKANKKKAVQKLVEPTRSGRLPTIFTAVVFAPQ